METLMQGLRHFEEIKLGYTDLAMVMRPDFPQPEFYKEIFKRWGMHTDVYRNQENKP